MQPSPKLMRVFRELLVLIEREAGRNPEFARELERIVEGLPERNAERKRKARTPGVKGDLPDVFAEFQEKGETEFRFWLRECDLQVLKRIVKANGFDPGKASRNWTEPDKFIALIADQVAARLRRGTAFLRPRGELPKSEPDT
jgi:hypothetical protein